MDEVIASVSPTLQSKIGAYRREHRLPGIAAGIATRDGLVWWHASGFADLELGRRLDERSLFRVASITKTVTATTVLQLRDEGRLGLDDPVVRFIPELAQVANPFGPIEALTIRRFLMHTSGLQGEVPWRDLDRVWMYRPEELLEVLSLARVRTPPETEFKYSNFAFELLGVVVERVASQPFQDHVRASVLEPLGMADTVWHLDADQERRRATGYDGRAHDDRPAEARQVDSDLMRADGGLWSTVENLGRWVGQQLRADVELERGPGQVLRGGTLAEMHRPTFVATPDWSEAQGLGWYGSRKGETVLIGHSGALWGYLTNISFSPRRNVGAIVLLNGVGGASALARELLDIVLPALAEAEDRAEVAAIPAIPAAYRQLLGVYRDHEFADDSVVEWRDGKLILLGSVPNDPAHELRPTDDPLTFTMLGGRPGGEPVVFSRGEDGRIDRANFAGYPTIRVDLLRPPTRS